MSSVFDDYEHLGKELKLHCVVHGSKDIVLNLLFSGTYSFVCCSVRYPIRRGQIDVIGIFIRCDDVLEVACI